MGIVGACVEGGRVTDGAVGLNGATEIGIGGVGGFDAVGGVAGAMEAVGTAGCPLADGTEGEFGLALTEGVETGEAGDNVALGNAG